VGDIPTMSYEEAFKNIERRASRIETIDDNQVKTVNRLTNSGGHRPSIKLERKEVNKQM